MAVKVGSFQIDTSVATTQIPVTGVGFEPDAVFLRWTGRNASTDAGPGKHDLMAGFGYILDNGKRGCISEVVQNNADPYAVGSGIWNTQAVVRQSNTGATSGKADYVSMDSDGFTLVIDEQFGAEITVSYIAISGKQFNVIEFSEPGATGNQSYTGAGFEPTFALFLQATWQTSYDTMIADSRLGIGAAIGSDAAQQAVWAKFEAHGLGYANTGTYCRRTECLAGMNGDTSVDMRASLVSFDSDGFTLNWLERAASRVCLAIVSDGRWYVNNDVTKTNTTPFSLSGFTWQPEGAMFFSACNIESTQDVGQRISSGGVHRGGCSVGFATSETERNCLYTRYTQDGITGTSRSVSQHEFDEVYISANKDSAPAVSGLMDVNSAFAADDIDLVMDNAEAEETFFFYVAIGAPVVEFRDRLVQLSHNTFQSRRANRLMIRDKTGRVLPPEHVPTDVWTFSGAFGYPTPVKYDNLLEDPNTFYSEATDVIRGRLRMGTDREAFLDTILRAIGRG